MYSTEQLTQRWEDQRAIKNLMGKYANIVLLNREEEVFSRFWSGNEPTLAFNDGVYRGVEAVKAYYNACRDRNALVPQYYLYDSLGWTNKLISLITPNLGGVFNIFLLRNFMHGIPKDLDESARIDGANDLMIYTRIIMPIMYPSLMVVALFSFNGSWNDLMWPSLSITSASKQTLTAGMRLLNDSYGGYYERVLAACMLAMIPTFLLYLVARKYFMQGLQLSAAVKG